MDPKKDAPKPGPGEAQAAQRKKLLRIGFWAVLALAAILVLRGILDDDSTSTATTRPAEIVSVEELRDAASSQGSPIYWAGLQDGTELELSQPDEGSAYVRYLSEGTDAGDPGTEFLTVGTYDFADAADALRNLSKGPGGVLASSPGGGVVYFNRQRPQNVYLAFPDSDLQIEVFDPDPKRALGLVASGQIVPVD